MASHPSPAPVVPQENMGQVIFNGDYLKGSHHVPSAEKNLSQPAGPAPGKRKTRKMWIVTSKSCFEKCWQKFGITKDRPFPGFSADLVDGLPHNVKSKNKSIISGWEIRSPFSTLTLSKVPSSIQSDPQQSAFRPAMPAAGQVYGMEQHQVMWHCYIVTNKKKIMLVEKDRAWWHLFTMPSISRWTTHTDRTASSARWVSLVFSLDLELVVLDNCHQQVNLGECLRN